MTDPDIKQYEEAAGAVNLYEWAIGDDVGIHTLWHIIDNFTILDQKHVRATKMLNATCSKKIFKKTTI